MKFQCDRCKTRYSIADEKVRGKVLKIRCKNCASIITVREGAAAEPKAGPAAVRPQAAPAKPISPQVSSTPAPRPVASKAPVLAKAFEKAMTAPMPARARVPDGSFDDEDELLAAPTRVADPPLPLLDEWYLSVDGSQDGPFTLSQAQQRISDMPPGEEVYSWRDGFADWLAVEKVPELAGHVRSRQMTRRVAVPPPQMRAPAAPMSRPVEPAPMAAAPAGPSLGKTIHGIGPEQGRAPSIVDDRNTPIPLAELAAAATSRAPVTRAPEADKADNGQQKRPPEGHGEGFDLMVGEASQMVNLSTLRSMATGAVPRTAPNNGQAPGPSTVPGVAPMTPALPGQTAVGRGTGSNVLGLNAGPAALGLTPSPVLLQPRRRRSGLLIALAALLTAAVVGGIILFVMLRNRSGTAADDEDVLARGPGGGSEVIDNFYQGGGGLPGSNAPAGSMKPSPTTPNEEGGARPNRTGLRVNNSTQAPRATIGPSGKQDLFTNDDPESVTVDDILDKGKMANPAMKQCYNRALKNDPMLKLTRMDLRITVGSSGLVTDVRAMTNGTKSKMLTDCLVGIVKSWRFRRSSEGLTADLPIIFSNG